MDSGVIPKKLHMGRATHAEKEPLMAKTIKMAMTDQLLLMPHLVFNFSSIVRIRFKHQPQANHHQRNTQHLTSV